MPRGRSSRVVVLSLLLCAASRAAGRPCEAALRREQWVTQTQKDLRRTLREYDVYLFRWAGGRRGRRFSVVRDGDGAPPAARLVDWLDRRARALDRPLRWSDVGAGFAVPMREIARAYPLLNARLEVTAVDLFDWDRTRHHGGEAELIAEAGPDVLAARFKPPYLLGDAARAVPRDQDLITSVEVIQYLPDKLAAVAHWYNQLADDGVLLISTEHHFTNQILVDRKDGRTDGVLEEALIELARAGIRVGAVGTWPEVQMLAIRKRPGTRLRALTRPVGRDLNRWRYLFVRYPGAPYLAVESSR